MTQLAINQLVLMGSGGGGTYYWTSSEKNATNGIYMYICADALGPGNYTTKPASFRVRCIRSL